MRDDLDQVICHHGRPFNCLECGNEYEAELNASPVQPEPSSVARGARNFWGVVTDGHAMPCLFGHKSDAEENRDTDERVALFRVEEVVP